MKAAQQLDFQLQGQLCALEIFLLTGAKDFMNQHWHGVDNAWLKSVFLAVKLAPER